MRRFCAALLLYGLRLAGQAAEPTPLADFEARIADYMKIHRAAESDMGRLAPTKSSDTLDTKQKAIAEGILSRHGAAVQGAIFTSPVGAEFRRLIGVSLKHRPTSIRGSIQSGELVLAKVHVGMPYPEGVPFETMPPTLLLALPKLPQELDYRLVGTGLLLRDVSANLIVDILPNAISPN